MAGPEGHPMLFEAGQPQHCTRTFGPDDVWFHMEADPGTIDYYNRKVLMFSPFVQHSVARLGLGMSPEAPVVLPKQVTPEVLPMVLDYCWYHHVKGHSIKECKLFDEKFMRLDTRRLCELTSAADSLKIKALVDLTSRALAKMIEGKSPEEIRSTFNLPDDLTEEEKLEPLKSGPADARIKLLNKLYAKKRQNLAVKKAAVGKPAVPLNPQPTEDCRSVDQLLRFIGDDSIGKKGVRRKKKGSNRGKPVSDRSDNLVTGNKPDKQQNVAADSIGALCRRDPRVPVAAHEPACSSPPCGSPLYNSPPWSSPFVANGRCTWGSSAISDASRGLAEVNGLGAINSRLSGSTCLGLYSQLPRGSIDPRADVDSSDVAARLLAEQLQIGWQVWPTTRASITSLLDFRAKKPPTPTDRSSCSSTSTSRLGASSNSCSSLLNSDSDTDSTADSSGLGESRGIEGSSHVCMDPSTSAIAALDRLEVASVSGCLETRGSFCFTVPGFDRLGVSNISSRSNTHAKPCSPAATAPEQSCQRSFAHLSIDGPYVGVAPATSAARSPRPDTNPLADVTAGSADMKVSTANSGNSHNKPPTGGEVAPTCAGTFLGRVSSASVPLPRQARGHRRNMCSEIYAPVTARHHQGPGSAPASMQLPQWHQNPRDNRHRFAEHSRDLPANTLKGRPMASSLSKQAAQPLTRLHSHSDSQIGIPLRVSDAQVQHTDGQPMLSTSAVAAAVAAAAAAAAKALEGVTRRALQGGVQAGGRSMTSHAAHSKYPIDRCMPAGTSPGSCTAAPPTERDLDDLVPLRAAHAAASWALGTLGRSGISNSNRLGPTANLGLTGVPKATPSGHHDDLFISSLSEAAAGTSAATSPPNDTPSKLQQRRQYPCTTASSSKCGRGSVCQTCQSPLQKTLGPAADYQAMAAMLRAFLQAADHNAAMTVDSVARREGGVAMVLGDAGAVGARLPSGSTVQLSWAFVPPLPGTPEPRG